MDSRLEDSKKETITHLLLLELGPVLLVVDHEALGSLWVTHLVECVWSGLVYWLSGQEICSDRSKLINRTLGGRSKQL